MRHSSLILGSATPFLNTSRQVLANDQNAAGTCARIAWLSGRGVPSRAQRSNSAIMAGSLTVADATIVVASLACCRNRAERATPVTRSLNPIFGATMSRRVGGQRRWVGACPYLLGFCAAQPIVRLNQSLQVAQDYHAVLLMSRKVTLKLSASHTDRKQ